MRLGNGRLLADSRSACHYQQSGTSPASKESTTTVPAGAAVKLEPPISFRMLSKLLVIAVWMDAAVEGFCPSLRVPPEMPMKVVNGPAVTRPTLASTWNFARQIECCDMPYL